jgi:hypothetical protein
MPRGIRSSIALDGKIYKTQKEVKDYVRGVIHTLGVGAKLGSRDPYFSLFFALIKRHPESDNKIGVGIDFFEVRKNFRGISEMWIVRNDGSEIDFSWVTCVTGLAQSAEQKLSAAMRRAVKSQILDFRISTELPSNCEICGSPITDLEGADVDHVRHFETLISDFRASSEMLPPAEFADCEETNSAMFRLMDKDFAEAWESFHAEKAELRLVHSSCNRRREKAVL